MVQTSNKVCLAILVFCVLSGVVLATPTVPTGIVKYLPITLTNYQNTAVAANTLIAIGTPLLET